MPLLSLSGIRLSDLLGRYKYRRESPASQVEQEIHAQHNLIGERMTYLVISSQNHFIYYGLLRHSKEEVLRSTRLNKVEIQLLFRNRKPYSLLDDTRNASQQERNRSLKREDMQLACGLKKTFSTCFSLSWKRTRGTSLLIKRIDRKNGLA